MIQDKARENSITLSNEGVVKFKELSEALNERKDEIFLTNWKEIKKELEISLNELDADKIYSKLDKDIKEDDFTTINVFKENVDSGLQVFYRNTNGKFFEKCDLSDYEECFGSINPVTKKLSWILGTQPDFAYFLSQLQDKLLDDTKIKSKNLWFSQRFTYNGTELDKDGISSYKSKRNAGDRQKKFTKEINSAIEFLIPPNKTPNPILNTSLNIDKH